MCNVYLKTLIKYWTKIAFIKNSRDLKKHKLSQIKKKIVDIELRFFFEVHC